jgi:hypothetical protein
MPIVILAIMIGSAVRPGSAEYVLPYLQHSSVSIVTVPYVHNLFIPAALLAWRLVLNRLVLCNECRCSGALAMGLYFIWAIGSTKSWDDHVYRLSSVWVYYIPPVLWLTGPTVIWRYVSRSGGRKAMSRI